MRVTADSESSFAQRGSQRFVSSYGSSDFVPPLVSASRVEKRGQLFVELPTKKLLIYVVSFCNYSAADDTLLGSSWWCRPGKHLKFMQLYANFSSLNSFFRTTTTTTTATNARRRKSFCVDGWVVVQMLRNWGRISVAANWMCCFFHFYLACQCRFRKFWTILSKKEEEPFYIWSVDSPKLEPTATVYASAKVWGFFCCC